MCRQAPHDRWTSCTPPGSATNHRGDFLLFLDLSVLYTISTAQVNNGIFPYLVKACTYHNVYLMVKGECAHLHIPHVYMYITSTG